MTPKFHMLFDHRRIIDEHKQPMRMIVTRIAKGTVYYRPLRGGGVECCPIDQFDKWAMPARELAK